MMYSGTKYVAVGGIRGSYVGLRSSKPFDFSFLRQLNVVQLRDRLSRAQGEGGTATPGNVAPHGGPATLPHRMTTPAKPAADNQYYPQVTV